MTPPNNQASQKQPRITLATAKEVDKKITEMAKEIIVRFNDSNPLFVCLLRGGAPFATKLMFAIVEQVPDFHPELDYLTISTYGDDRTAKQSRIVMDLAPDTQVHGRDVIILDDVLDQGYTAAFAREHLVDLGAKEVVLAVLVQKKLERLPEVTRNADFFAFEAPADWLIGMGMDDRRVAYEANRWMSSIAIADS